MESEKKLQKEENIKSEIQKIQEKIRDIFGLENEDDYNHLKWCLGYEISRPKK